MSKTPKKPKRASSGFSICREDFEKICAVDDIYFSDEMKHQFDEFDLKGLSNKERRRVIAEKYGAKSPKS